MNEERKKERKTERKKERKKERTGSPGQILKLCIEKLDLTNNNRNVSLNKPSGSVPIH